MGGSELLKNHLKGKALKFIFINWPIYDLFAQFSGAEMKLITNMNMYFSLSGVDSGVVPKQNPKSKEAE